MENTKEEVYKVYYNSSLNRLKTDNNNLIDKLIENIKKNKFITTVIIAFVMFSTLNIAMIYSFMKILQNI